MNGSAWIYEEAIKTAAADTHTPSTKFAMPIHTSSRNVSGPLAIDTSNMTPDPNSTASPWARSNPHTAPQNSKTSQYIDKITSENERLRRELKVEKLARDEETQRAVTAATRAEEARTECQRLQILDETNSRTIERKDRKVEELKAAVNIEANRRKVAEERTAEALKVLGDTRSNTQRDLAKAYEMRMAADANADSAREGFKRKHETLQKKARNVEEDLNELRRLRIEDADKVKRLTIIGDQLQHELTRTLRAEHLMVDLMGRYKKEHREEVEGLVKEAERMRALLSDKEKEAEGLVEMLKETRDKMKWVMAQQQRQGP